MDIKEEHFQIHSEIWEDTLNVIFTEDIDLSIRTQCEIQGFDHKPYMSEGKVIDGCVLTVEEPNYRSIWFLLKIGCVESTVVHELEHFVFRLLDSKGICHNYHTTEVFAYTFAFYYKEIMKIYAKFKPKNKK